MGPEAFFSGKGGRRAPEDFADGMSATLAIFEAGEGVVWTAPDELSYAADKPLPKFGDWYGIGFNLALCDGSVRLHAHKIDEATMRALITVGGREPIVNPDGQKFNAPGTGPGQKK